MDDIQYYEGTAPKARKSRRLLFIIIIIVILAVLALLASRFFGAQKQPATTALAPTPTDYIFPTESPSASASGTPTVSVSPAPSGKITPTGSSTVDKATGLDRANLTVSVLNGSGVAGAATKLSTSLKNLGYDVVSTGNADAFTYQGLTIRVKPTKSKYLTLLKKDLSQDYTITSATADLPSSVSSDAQIIFGK